MLTSSSHHDVKVVWCVLLRATSLRVAPNLFVHLWSELWSRNKPKFPHICLSQLSTQNMRPTLGEHACLASAIPVSLGRAMHGLQDFKTQEVLTPSGTMRDRQHRSIAPDCPGVIPRIWQRSARWLCKITFLTKMQHSCYSPIKIGLSFIFLYFW